MNRAKKTVIYLMTMLAIIILIGAVTINYLEGWPFIDSLYWAVMTVLTIGDAVHVPSLAITKGFVIIYAIIGVSAALYALLNLATYVLEKHQRGFERIGEEVPKKIGKVVRKIKKRNNL